VAGWLGALTDADLSDETRRRRFAAAHERFSWDVLAPRYVAMLRDAARADRSAT
jgi:hypothetical protein